MIKFETNYITLAISEKGFAESLIFKPTGEELLCNQPLPLFSITEERPYNNEIKLAYPNKETTFIAKAIVKEDDILTVSFDRIHFKAKVKVEESEGYLAFTLVGFDVPEREKSSRAMYIPPVFIFRLINLPVKKRERFGEWLNMEWDGKASVGVFATSPCEKIDSEERAGFRILYADCKRDVKLEGSTAVLFACPTERFLEEMAKFEEDYALPNGARSRMSKDMKASAFWVETVNPSNVDEHIAYCKKAGFRFMLIYYRSIFCGEDCYKYIGNYDYLPTYPRGIEDLKEMLRKIRDAGIIPGIHFLHTHIGIHSRYVTPIPDHRLNLRRHFTLAKAIDENSKEIFVEEDPTGSFIDPDRRVLRFGDELIYYESYTTERPFAFKGIKRGHLDTYPSSHKIGTIGGLLDLSEYGAWSIHIDQRSSLQDEIAEKLAEIYDAGFGFAYFDGSEGTNAPYEYEVASAQYKVYKKLGKEPLFCEAAAKSHFSWHMISGGNAFDVFPDEIFKEKIVEFPLDEAPKAQDDFTRVDFGWWRYSLKTTPDIYEFGTSRAAAWDCPVTVAADMETCRSHPRTDDIFEILRRWEEAREKDLLSKETKEALKSTKTEHILLRNADGSYEAVPYFEVKTSSPTLSAWVFEKDRPYAVLWDNEGECEINLELTNARLGREYYENDIPIEKNGNTVRVKVSSRMYLTADTDLDGLVSALKGV